MSETDAEQLEAKWRVLRAQPHLPRFAPTTLRAAWWALRAVRRARRDLSRSGLAARVSPPPTLPWGSRLGVDGVLRRLEPTCLERCLVQQAWLRAHGVEHDVVIGVASGAQHEVTAHAWLEHITAPHEYAGYRPIHRLPPR